MFLYTGSSSGQMGSPPNVPNKLSGRPLFYGRSMVAMMPHHAQAKMDMDFQKHTLEYGQKKMLYDLRTEFLTLVKNVPKTRSTSAYARDNPKKRECIVPTCTGGAKDYRRHLIESHRMCPKDADSAIFIYNSVSVIVLFTCN